MDTVLEVQLTEVYEQANLLPAQFQIRQQLRFVQRVEFFHCFQFHNDFVIDKEIYPLAQFHIDTS